MLETGQKCIVECTPNTIWGTGVAISDKETLNKNKWNGEGEIGLMGMMLMKICEELRIPEDMEEQEENNGGNTEMEEKDERMETTTSAETDDDSDEDT